ncbi:hypothetical protein [Acetobacter persici]|uniref:Uncharacterized protein n=1 Tax=Acetobacter persici TaxID=1076596 RepID=A0A1U9LIV2_9PROT|nr:hypothetical protein [Acetobacter persici]AQT06351.1 hypothetical protein A0U91_15145 [Acetobacter persici]
MADLKDNMENGEPDGVEGKVLDQDSIDNMFGGHLTTRRCQKKVAWNAWLRQVSLHIHACRCSIVFSIA